MFKSNNAFCLSFCYSDFLGVVLEFSENVGVETNEEMQTLTLTFPNNLKVGDGVIHLKFSGELNDKMKGFYRSKYFGPNKEERYAAVTQFEVSWSVIWKY